MIELIVVAAVAFAALLVVGVLAAGLSLIFLPFQILGWIFKGLGLLLFIPLMLVFAFVGVMVFGVGMAFFLVPLVPLVLVVWLLWRALRRPATPIST